MRTVRKDSNIDTISCQLECWTAVSAAGMCSCICMRVCEYVCLSVHVHSSIFLPARAHSIYSGTSISASASTPADMLCIYIGFSRCIWILTFSSHRIFYHSPRFIGRDTNCVVAFVYVCYFVCCLHFLNFSFYSAPCLLCAIWFSSMISFLGSIKFVVNVQKKEANERERKREKDRWNEQKKRHQWAIQLFSRNVEPNIKCNSVKKQKRRLVSSLSTSKWRQWICDTNEENKTKRKE